MIVQNNINWQKINENESVAHFTSQQNNQLVYVKKWHARAVHTQEKIIFLFHDICQYHGRYNSLIRWYQEQDSEVSFVAMDFVGHGLSSGTRGHFDQLDFLVNDIFYLLNNTAKKEDQLWYILGQGLGGLCILDLINRYPAQLEEKINGIVLSNFIYKMETLNFLKEVREKFSSYTSKWRTHKFFSGQGMTCDFHEIILYEQDSLIIHRATWSALAHLKKKSDNIYRDAYFLNVPILILKSGNDSYLQERGIDFFISGIKKELLTEKYYSNLKHDLYNEIDKTSVFNDLQKWINTNENNF